MLKNNNLIGFGAGNSNYVPNAVHFSDTTGLQISNQSSLVPVGVVSTGIISFWFKIDSNSPGSFFDLFQSSGVTGSLFWGVTVTHSIGGYPNKPYISILYDPTVGATQFFDMTTSSTYVAGSGWHHYLCSYDVGHNSGSRLGNLYIDDVNQKNIIVDGPGGPMSQDYGSAPGCHYSDGSPGQGLVGGLSEMYFAPGQYLDFSITSNRRKFISSTLHPVSLGSDGSKPTGTIPAVYLNNPAVSVTINKGFASNFTNSGTVITDEGTHP